MANDKTLGFDVDPDTNGREDEFRAEVRNILDLGHLTRNAQIYEELRKLKALDLRVAAMRGSLQASLQEFRTTNTETPLSEVAIDAIKEGHELPAITGTVNVTGTKPTV